MLNHIRTYLCTVFATVVLTMTPALHAGAALPEVLSIDGSGNISRWDLATMTRSFYTPSGLRGFGSMTRTLDGRYLVFRTSYQGGVPGFYQVNPDSGGLTLLNQSTSSASKVVAMTHTRDGDFLASDNSLHFLRIDPTTLVYSPITLTRSDNGAELRYSGAMATAPNGDIYTWATGSHDGYLFSNLFRIDLETETAFRIAGFDEINHTKGLNAMSFTPDGRLFVFTDINSGTSGELFDPVAVYQINLTTGQINKHTLPGGLGSNILGSIRGAEFIPEPASLTLLAPLLMVTGRPQRYCSR